MTSLSWRSQLARALHRNRALADSRYLQLATVGKNGRPANRTLVFRGFLARRIRYSLPPMPAVPKLSRSKIAPGEKFAGTLPKLGSSFALVVAFR